MKFYYIQSLTKNANVIDAKAEKHRAATRGLGAGARAAPHRRPRCRWCPGQVPRRRRADTVPLVVVPLRSGRTWR